MPNSLPLSLLNEPRQAENLVRPTEPGLLSLLRHCWDEGWLEHLPLAGVHTVAVGAALALHQQACPLLALEALQVIASLSLH